jgi:hypothetical protein
MGRQRVEMGAAARVVDRLQEVQVVAGPVAVAQRRSQAGHQHRQVRRRCFDGRIGRGQQRSIGGRIRPLLCPLQAQVGLVPQDDAGQPVAVALGHLAAKPA